MRLERAIGVVAALAALAAAGCQGTRHRGASSPAHTVPIAPVTTSRGGSATTTTYLAGPPFLSRHTGLRLLVSNPDALDLVALDGGAVDHLVKPEGDATDWLVTAATGGFIAQASVPGSGAGSIRAPVWFIPNGDHPAARRLGVGTGSLGEPNGGVWLVDLPNNNGGFGAGSITLTDTHGHVRTRGFITGQEQPLASIGSGRFITAVLSSDGNESLSVYDALSRLVVRQLTPRGTNSYYHGLEGRSVVWADDAQCTTTCAEHVVDVDTGATHDRTGDVATRSPDAAHTVRGADVAEFTTLLVDDRALANSDESPAGLQWSPDGEWLLFRRPDKRHFGIWHVGDANAETVPTAFAYFEEWAIFDQH